MTTPVNHAPHNPTSQSGAYTIAAAATSQTSIQAFKDRAALSITNNDATHNLYVNPVGAAYAGSAYVGMIIPPLTTFSYPGSCPASALAFASAQIGHSFFVLEGVTA